MRKAQKYVVVFCVISLISLIFTACSPSSPSVEKEYKMVVYSLAPHPYFETVKKGVDAFTADYGIPVEFVVGSNWTQQSENENVEALAAQGYNLFAIIPSDPNGANQLYKELVDRGSIVVNHSGVTSLPTPAQFYVGGLAYLDAVQATEAVLEQLGYKGNVIYTIEALGDPNSVLRKQAVLDTIAKYPDVVVLQEVADCTTVEIAAQKVGDAIAANIDRLDGIISPSGNGAEGAAITLLDYYAKNPDAKKIVFVGTDDNPNTLKGIEEGLLFGTINNNGYATGYISCLLLKYLADGWTANPDYYEVPSVSVLITKDNIRTFEQEQIALVKERKAELETKYLIPPAK